MSCLSSAGTASRVSLFLVAVAIVSAPAVFAQAEPTRAADAHQYGVGLAASFPAYGFSGMYDVSDQLSAQAVVGFGGVLSTATGRVLYRFNQKPAYDLFGYGSAGAWFGLGETVPAIGGGAGVEVNWGRVFNAEDFPPLFSTFEVGFATLIGDDLSGFSLLSGGGSLHYRF